MTTNPLGTPMRWLSERTLGKARPRVGPVSYSVVAANGAVDLTVHAGPRALAIALAMAAAGATAAPGVEYRVRRGHGRDDVAWESEPFMTYLAKPGEWAVGTRRRRKSEPRRR